MSLSPNRPTTSIALGLSEATWATLCFSAIVDTTPHFKMDVPYLSFALPTSVVLLIGFFLKRTPISVWTRSIILVLTALIATAISAGTLAALSVPGSFTAVAFHPWTVSGRIPSDTSGLAWFFASLAVSRGVLIGSANPTFGQTIRSVVLGVCSFLGLFLAEATSHTPVLHESTGLTEAWFICYFLVVLALLRLSRAREFEGAHDAIVAGGAPKIWLLLLLGPVLVIALAGLALALGLGSWGSATGRALLATIHALGHGATLAARGIGIALTAIVQGIAAAITAIVDLFGHHHGTLGRGKVVRISTTTTSPRYSPALHPPIVVAAILVSIFLIGLIVVLVQLSRQRRHGRAEHTEPTIEEISSLFSWRHVLGRLLAKPLWLLRWLRNRILRGHELDVRTAASGKDDQSHTVRLQYRRLLSNARTHGFGRARTETAAEYAARLAGLLETGEDVLQRLTARYERSRYSAVAASEDIDLTIASEIDILISLFNENAERASDELGPSLSSSHALTSQNN